MTTYRVKVKQCYVETMFIEAETEEEALALYNRGHYSDYDYDMDDLFYDHTFVNIREEETEPVNYYQGA